MYKPGPGGSQRELKADNLFTETFAFDGWEVSVYRKVEDRCLNKLANYS